MHSADGDLKGTITAASASAVHVTVDGVNDGQPFEGDITLTPEGTCITVKGDVTSDGDHEFLDDQLCPEDLFGDVDSPWFDSDARTMFGEPIDTAVSLDNLGKLVQFEQLSKLFDIGIVTVKVDGDWYVSPLRTTADLFGSFGRLTEGLGS